MLWSWIPVIALPILCGWTVKEWLKLDATRKSWGKVSGLITESRVLKEMRPEDDNRLYSYRASISYAYTVAGQAYQGSRIGWTRDAEWGSHKQAADLVWRYRTGKTVTVYYNPANPEQSVLTFSAEPLLTTLLGGVLLLAFAWVWLTFYI